MRYLSLLNRYLDTKERVLVLKTKSSTRKEKEALVARGLKLKTMAFKNEDE